MVVMIVVGGEHMVFGVVLKGTMNFVVDVVEGGTRGAVAFNSRMRVPEIVVLSISAGDPTSVVGVVVQPDARLQCKLEIVRR